MGCVGRSGRGGASPNAVVTSWDGGSLTVREMEMLYQRRFFLNEFLTALYQNGRNRVEIQGGVPSPPNVPAFFLNQNATPQSVMAGCVQEKILAEEAKKSGMAISDDMINHYLREIGFRQINDRDIRTILSGLRRGNLSTSEEWLFSGLRELLLGNLYTTSIGGSVMSVPPEQLWEDWLKINDRISLEAAVLPIDKFVSKVSEPNEGQLIAFYELHKNRISGGLVSEGGVTLPSPNPGFREPRKVKLKYLLGDVSEWTEKMLPSVTKEEIADYYERNKRTQFVKFDAEAEATVTEEAGSTKDENEETQVEETAATEEDAEEDSAEGETSDDETTVSKESDEEGEEEEEDVEEEEIEYEPLEEVSDEIRRQLANDKAVLELKSLMENAFGELTAVYNRYGGELVEARSEERELPPVPPLLANLSEMAKEKGLISEETVLLSAREMSETMVGKAVDAQSGREIVTQAAFSELRLHEPLLAQDLDGYWYLVVKVEDQPSRIPALDEIRDQVIAAWKRSEATRLALQNGEAAAKELQESGASLESFFANSGYEVVTTDLFSWFTFGNTPVEMQQGLRLSDAPPLSAVGMNFMERAFALKPDEITSLLNFDHSCVFVMKLSSRERTEQELRSAFLAEVNDSQAMRMMLAMRTQNAQQTLIGQLLGRLNLDRQSLQSFLQGDSGK